MNKSHVAASLGATDKEIIQAIRDGGLFVSGKVVRRTKMSGVKDGREWEKRTFLIQGRLGEAVELVDFNKALEPKVGDFVLVPIRKTGPVSPLGLGGGEDW